MKILVGAQGSLGAGHTGPGAGELVQDAPGFFLAQFSHQFQRAFSEGKGKPAAQFQVCGRTDVTVQDVHAL